MSVLHFFAQENIHFDGTYHRIMEPQTESTKEDQIEGKKIFLLLHINFRIFPKSKILECVNKPPI